MIKDSTQKNLKNFHCATNNIVFYSTDTVMFGTNLNKLLLYVPRLVGVFFIITLLIIGNINFSRKQ